MFMRDGEDTSKDLDGSTPQFPLYNGLYKVLEGMTSDDIITEVIQVYTIFPLFIFPNLRTKTSSWSLKNKQYYIKALLNRIHLNGHTLAFDQQTLTLGPPCTA